MNGNHKVLCHECVMKWTTTLSKYAYSTKNKVSQLMESRPCYIVMLILSLEGFLPNLEGNVHIPHIHIFNFLFTEKSLYIYKIALHSLGRETREVQASRCLPTRPTNKRVSHEKGRRYIFSAFWGYLNHLTLNYIYI
jgi:hypothetical protein